MKRGLFWCCLGACVLWTAFIFSRSAKSGVDSSAESGAMLALIDRFLSFWGMEFRPTELFLRKLGHFSEYFILGLLSFPSAKRFSRRLAALLSCGYAAAVALLDEFLVQKLSVGRGPSITDALIDLAGAATAILLLFALTAMLCQKRTLSFSK